VIRRAILTAAGWAGLAALVVSAVMAARNAVAQGFPRLGWFRLPILEAADGLAAQLVGVALAAGLLALLMGLLPGRIGGAGQSAQLALARRWRGGLAALVAWALVLLGLHGWIRADRATHRPSGPSAVVIVIDSLRADHVGCYGYPRSTTPHLDGFATTATRFTAAHSTAPWTTPSVASMFTGRSPSELGIDDRAVALDPRAPTLAERMRQAGYRTGGVVSHLLLSADLGFDQGFEWYDESAIGAVDATTSPAATDRALAFLDRHGDEPFLLFVHYFDPHYDYVAHPEFVFVDGYDGSLRSGQRIFALRELAPSLGPADREYLLGLYDSEIRHNDEQLGRLLAGLQERGLFDDTLVVVTSDHGEAFLERRDPWIGHSRTLFQELIRVPLVVKWPGQAVPAVVDTPVGLARLHATVAAEAGLEPSPQLPPPSPTWREPGAAALFAETGKGGRQEALIRYPWKLIHQRETARAALYDLANDPGERTDVSAEQPAVAAAMGELLDSWGERVAHGGLDRGIVEPRLSPAQIERLRDLGYL
jgi:arylsulfatase A-like enzyme